MKATEIFNNQMNVLELKKQFRLRSRVDIEERVCPVCKMVYKRVYKNSMSHCSKECFMKLKEVSHGNV